MLSRSGSLATAQIALSMLLLVGAVMLWRVFQTQEGPGDSGTLARFAVLLGALGWLSALSVV